MKISAINLRFPDVVVVAVMVAILPFDFDPDTDLDKWKLSWGCCKILDGDGLLAYGKDFYRRWCR